MLFVYFNISLIIGLSCSFSYILTFVGMEEKINHFYEYYVWKIYLIEFKNDIQLSVNYEIFNT